MKQDCKHDKWGSMGFQKIDANNTKVEVIAAIFCKRCGMIRTKILYYDRQRESRSET